LDVQLIGRNWLEGIKRASNSRGDCDWGRLGAPSPCPSGFAFLAIVAIAMDDRELLTASQAAEELSASSQTIRNWIRGERLRAVRIGNRFLIPRSEIDRMRGTVSTPMGESPWEFDPDAPAEPLPRAGGRDSGTDSAEWLLGG
jgi:excisionase family DNA binding protein